MLSALLVVSYTCLRSHWVFLCVQWEARMDIVYLSVQVPKAGRVPVMIVISDRGLGLPSCLKFQAYEMIPFVPAR